MGEIWWTYEAGEQAVGEDGEQALGPLRLFHLGAEGQPSHQAWCCVQLQQVRTEGEGGRASSAECVWKSSVSRGCYEAVAALI